MLPALSVESLPPPSRRRGPGRGSELTHLERERANALWVAGASKASIARTLGCSTAAVRHALTCPQGEAFQADARTELRKRRGDFVRDWVRASEVAAELGSHRPARDALAACGEIDMAAPATPLVVQFVGGGVLPGLPLPPSMVVPAPPALPPSRTTSENDGWKNRP